MGSKMNRRQVLSSLGLMGAGATLASCGTPVLADLTRSQADGRPDIDPQVLNFALNLEYLEAEYYLRATTGQGLSAADAGAGAGAVAVPSMGGPVPFADPALRQYAEELAADEQAHVRFLRSALGPAAVSRPAIDLNASFTAAARAAGLAGPTEQFNPFADQLSFLLGSFIFEDVGVTAYKGAARLIHNLDFLDAAAGILAAEAYHAATIRTLLYNHRMGTLGQVAAGKISDARDSLDGATDLDQGIVMDGKVNITPLDANGIAFSRTVQQVLNIVYLNPAAGVSSGGFFPNGLNGAIKTT
jgi:hypothetical protein